MSQRIRIGTLSLALLALLVPTLGGCMEFYAGRWEELGKPFGYLDVDGLRVHYRELTPAAAVDAETVVFIHGYAGGLVSWLHAQPELARRFRTVSLDLKGFGLSGKPEGDYSEEAQVAILLGVMDRLGVRKAHLVAHSWGCAVALRLAHAHPERVGRLVLVSGFVYEEQLNSFLRWSRLPVMGEVLYGLFYDQQLEARYTWSYFEPEPYISARGLDYVKAFQDSPGVTAAALATVRGMDLAALQPMIREVQAPALLVWGEQDPVSSPRFGERLASELPHARLVTLARAGHSVMIERAGTFNALVTEFLVP